MFAAVLVPVRAATGWHDPVELLGGLPAHLDVEADGGDGLSLWQLGVVEEPSVPVSR